MVKIGFELEINTNSDIPRNNYHSFEYEKIKNFSWRFEKDGSLGMEGIEIISPAFGKRDLKKIEEDLTKIFFDYYPGDWWIDKRCGFHVNFSYENCSKLFLFKRLLFLRENIFNFIKKNYSNHNKFIESYFREYAKKIYDYSNYKSTKYLEFNIKENYIEWRSINLHHLIGVKKENLIPEIIKLLKFLFRIIEKSKEIKKEENEFKSYICIENDIINKDYYIKIKSIDEFIRKHYIKTKSIIDYKKKEDFKFKKIKKKVKKIKLNIDNFKDFKNEYFNSVINIKNFNNIYV